MKEIDCGLNKVLLLRLVRKIRLKEESLKQATNLLAFLCQIFTQPDWLKIPPDDREQQKQGLERRKRLRNAAGAINH